MIVIAFALLGALLGLRAAKKRNGNRADLWQYGAVYAMGSAVLGMFLTIITHNLLD